MRPIATPAAEPCARLGRSEIRGDTLYVDGRIDSGTLDLLLFQNAGAAVRRVELNSYGGSVEDAAAIAAYVRSRGMETHLRAGAFCASSCVMVFQAGTVRTAHPTARLGVHGVRTRVTPKELLARRAVCGDPPRNDAQCHAYLTSWYAESLADTKDFFRKLSAYGASPTLGEHYLALEDEPFWYERGNGLRLRDWVLSAQAAAAYNVVTRVEANPPAGPARSQ